MDEFSYLSVLISVILGLAVTQILKGFRGILSHGHGFGFTGRSLRGLPSCCWCVRRTGGRCLGCETATIGRSSNFTMVLLNTILIYMITALVYPDFFGEGVVDLKENFYAHRGWFFTLAFSTIVVSVLQRCYSRWQIAEHDESHLPRGLRRNVIHRRFDPLGALPQRTCCFWQRALRRLYRRAVWSNSLSSIASSASYCS